MQLTSRSITRKGARERRRGSAVVLALLSVVVLGGMTVALLGIGLSFNDEQTSRIDDESALLVAEAGLEEALFALRMGKTGVVGSLAAPARYGHGLLWVERADLGNALIQQRSIGLVGRGRVALARLVFHYHHPSFTTALFSSNSFTLESNTFVDSYDSTQGSYAAQLALSGESYVGDGAIVMSNGELGIDPSVEVFGDVHPGPGYDVDVPGSADVSGSLEPLPEDVELPPVAVPAVPMAGPLAVPAGGVLVLPPGDHGFSALDVVNGTFVIQGPARVVLGNWRLRSNTQLVMDDSLGKIELFVSGTTTLASNSSIVTSSGSPLGVAMNFVGGPGQYVDLRSNSSYCGTIYAPEATVDIHSNFEIFGSAVAKQLVVNANVKVHFDEALNLVPTGSEDFVTSSWSLAALPGDGFQTQRSDPYAALGVSPGGLEGPWGAHEE